MTFINQIDYVESAVYCVKCDRYVHPLSIVDTFYNLNNS